MIRAFIERLILVGVAATLTGCQAAVKPDPGLSALRVKVRAEPKVGAPADESGYNADAQPNRAFEPLEYADLPDIVVWLEPAPAAAAPSASPLPDSLIDVNSELPTAFRVVPVSVGQRIVLHNTSSKAGGVYSVSEGNEFSLTSVQPDGTFSYTVRSPGPVEILTDANREPLAEVYAAPSRWVLAGRSGAQLVFNNIPPGQYRLVSWHPRLPGTAAAVTLAVDTVSDATIRVGVNELPKVNAK